MRLPPRAARTRRFIFQGWTRLARVRAPSPPPCKTCCSVDTRTVPIAPEPRLNKPGGH